MKHLVAPSILSSDFAHLAREVSVLNESQADWIHVDVMDGVFVPNISFGIPILQAIKKYATKPLDVHLMITHPMRYVEAFRRVGAAVISVHIEADAHLHRTVRLIKEIDCKAGVAINPHTPISWLEEIVGEIDVVCLMAVNPGFGGQQFIENTYQKVKALKKLIIKKKAHALIEVDGGVNQHNAGKLIDSGADVLVAGNYVFSAASPQKAIAALKAIR